MRIGLVLFAVVISTPAYAATFTVGQAVVAEWQSGEFYAGKVTAADAKTVTVAWADGSAPSPAPIDKTFAIPKPTDKRPLKAGDLALCAWSGDTRWYDCRVSKIIDKGGISVAYLDGDSGTVGWDGILVPTGAAAKELASRAAAGPTGGGGGGGGGEAKPASDDGFNPTLHNDDEHSYDYDLECGASTTHTDIGSDTTITLSKGCTLKINGAEKALHGNMECVIKDGSLSCS